MIDDAGEHHFTVWVKAHQADCGNSQPTTYMGDARDVYEEGALIFPAVKVQEDYEELTDIVRMCEMRIRVPEQWRGDFLAMMGAARIGEREILAMGEEYGWDTLHAFTARVVRLQREAHARRDREDAERRGDGGQRPRSRSRHAA